MIGRLGLVGMFRIVDHCADMPAAYMLSDVVVSASNEPEGFGRVIIEAQAMGRPVVATDHGGARETILPGVTGWLAAPGDPAALADAIGEALALDGEARSAFARRAISHIAAGFTQRADVRAHDRRLRGAAVPAIRDRRWRPGAGAAGNTGIVWTLVGTRSGRRWGSGA